MIQTQLSCYHALTDLDLPQRLLRQDSPSIHLPIRQCTALTMWRNTLTMGQTAKAKVRLTTEATEDISNVVLCSDTIFERGVPIFNDAFDDLNACVENVGNGDREAILFGGGEMI